MWKCPHCASQVEDWLGACWQCGTSPTGEVDPTFVREVHAADLPADWVPRVHCEHCGYRGKVLLKHVGYRWWMLALCIVLLPLGILGLVLLMILGNSRYKACPQCGSPDQLKDITNTTEEPTKEAELLWQNATAAAAQEFQHNKVVLLLGMLVLLAISVGLLLYFNQQWLQS